MKYDVLIMPSEYASGFKVGRSVRYFDKELATKYFTWYMSIKDNRIKVLEEAVKTTIGFENWKADFSPESLYRLQEWFEKVVESRPTTQEEKRVFMSEHTGVWKIVIKPLEWTLTEQTQSSCHDVGIYFAEVLRKNNPHLEWGQDLKDKKSIGFNFPVLLMKGFDFNPYNQATIAAQKIIEGRKNDWRKLYEYWDKYAKECNSKDNRSTKTLTTFPEA